MVRTFEHVVTSKYCGEDARQALRNWPNFPNEEFDADANLATAHSLHEMREFVKEWTLQLESYCSLSIE